jgi:serine phosphatase RsbU (regulator of sigma subunit)/pSer/pThr/pTyr-binding forkhead associated (FHA) protein
LAKAAASAPRLEWNESPERRETFQLTLPEILIGRRADAQIVLTHPVVSRQHARITREDHPDGTKWVIVDLQSSHGTWVNGSRIDRRPLHARDRIRLGEQGVEMLYLEEGESQLSSSTSLLDGLGVERSMRRLAGIPEEPGGHSELEKISCLLDLHYSFGKAFSAEKTFQHILQSALTISGAERGFIMRRASFVADAGSGRDFRFEVGLDGFGRLLDSSEFHTSGTVVERAVKTGQSVFMTQGIDGDLAGSESIVAMALRAIACMPLVAVTPETDVTIVMGILYLDSRKHMHSLSGLDEKLLTRLAHEAGHVLEKIEMVVTLAEKKRIEQELAVAEETQRSLLPQSLPEVEPFRIRAFSRPTRQLGGDFYDFIKVPDGLLTGVLGDVSGKGIPAALLSSLTIGALNMEFRSTAKAGAVLGAVSRVLCEKTPAHRFVTMFLFQLAADGKGHYISAGHNPAYLFRAATGKVEELPSGGMPMGMFPFAQYEPVALELKPGDILLVYSDGLTEAENDRQEDFSEERLLNLVCAEAPKGVEEMEKTLLSELDRFTQGAMQTDDITFLLLENHAG